MDGASLIARRRPGGALTRLARVWVAPREAARPEIEGAGEGRLFAYAVAGSLIHTVATFATEALAPRPEVAADPTGWATAQLAGGLFVRPLALYGVAALLGLACRAAGGRGGWRATRGAVFWSGLAAAPAALALALLGALAGAPEAGRMAGAVLWALTLAPALAEAQGFHRAWPILAVLAGAAALAAFAAAAA